MSSVLTYVDLSGQTYPVGTAYVTVRRGRLSSTFSYEAGYLARPDSYAIEPSFGLSAGRWASPNGLPRAFGDAAPDRWGRNLIAKRHRAAAAAQLRPPSQLDEADYLLGVSDVTRQGALRFKTRADEDFQHPGPEVPKLLALPALRHAADQVARDDPDDLSAIKVLLDAGTGSLGGARPKASVRDGERLLIAKFGHPADEWNVMAWEKTTLDLAVAAGVAVPRSQLLDVEGHTVLLLDRFDRDHDRRIGYVSAMTLLEAGDGEARDYVEIAETIPEHSSSTSADLAELWRRIAFSIAVHNTDDHLRNHGFLRAGAGWRLAPMFDVNPTPDLGARRVTGIGGATGPAEEASALLAFASTFGLTRAQGQAIFAEVAGAVSGWAPLARRHGIPAGQISRFAHTLDETVRIVAAAA
jgi:serine/threonine-protein kinase HipA